MDRSPFHGLAAMQSTEAASAACRRPSLLPAFEPLSSSPGGLPRTMKRKFDETLEERLYYPTPVPTSSTGLLPSSPPSRRSHPALPRTVSTLSERAPLGDVPSLQLPSNGEPLLMGRSSNSSDYQLSANRLISRVHVRASYISPKTEDTVGKVEIECLGWNGAKVHCRGEIVELAKGECFVSDRPLAQIMVDVQDTRVMLDWPREAREPGLRPAWSEESPSKRRSVSHDDIASSPPALPSIRQQTPISPTPASGLGATFNSTFRLDPADRSPVAVYEDHSSDDDAPGDDATPTPVDLDTSMMTVTAPCEDQLKVSRDSNSSENAELSEHDEENEENDPIVHSFGPFGENLLSRFESIKSASPERKRKPLKVAANSPSRIVPAPKASQSPIKNHVINQLAFSRIHSLPLSTIHSNLPAELRGAKTKSSSSDDKTGMTTSSLKVILDDIPCIGEISREGKDAAGKLLESEFYYVPEMDNDEMRRDAVTQSLGKTSIRAARKQHKQYYWKRPRH